MARFGKTAIRFVCACLINRKLFHLYTFFIKKKNRKNVTWSSTFWRFVGFIQNLTHLYSLYCDIYSIYKLFYKVLHTVADQGSFRLSHSDGPLYRFFKFPTVCSTLPAVLLFNVWNPTTIQLEITSTVLIVFPTVFKKFTSKKNSITIDINQKIHRNYAENYTQVNETTKRTDFYNFIPKGVKYNRL